MPQSLLKRAQKLLRRKRFSHVIRLLESQVFRFRQNPEFFFLLGTACLYSGDYGGAESYLKRSDQLKPQDVQTLLGLAVIHARRGETDGALETWLRIVELNPGCRQAARGLELLRTAANTEDPGFFQDSKRIIRLYPRLPLDPRTILFPIMAVAAAAVIAAGLYLIVPRLPRLRPVRPGVQEVQLSPGQPALSADTTSSLVLTEIQIRESFELIKRDLLQYRDNLAIREINRLLNSNASIYVKEKAKLLKTFVREPDFTTIKDSFPYTEVAVNPALYEDCYVLWSGKVANVRVSPQAIDFDLLVGYQDERELQGVVPVKLQFAFDLENGIGVEVLGKILLRDGSLALLGRSLHRLYKVK
jgi:tetratricopeptide (TPR) repeat protein